MVGEGLPNVEFERRRGIRTRDLHVEERRPYPLDRCPRVSAE